MLGFQLFDKPGGKYTAKNLQNRKSLNVGSKKPPAEQNKKKKKKPKVDYKKWLLIGSSLAKLAGGTDYNEESRQSYEGTQTTAVSQGDKGYIKPDIPEEGNGNGKKKKKKNGGY